MLFCVIIQRLCMCVLVAQSCPTLCDPMECSSPGSPVHGIAQARILEWVSIPFSRGSSQPSDWTQVSCITGRFFTGWAIREAQIVGLKIHVSIFVVGQSLSHVWCFVTPWTAACQASLSFTIYQRLLTLMPLESVMPSNYLILCCPRLFPPLIFPSIWVFSNESVLRIRWPKYWSFSISVYLWNSEWKVLYCLTNERLGGESLKG